MTRRNYILTAALLVTLWLTWVSLQAPKTPDISAPTRELPSSMQAHRASDTSLVLSKRDIAPSVANLFETPVVPKQITRAATFKAPPPVAPPLPFKYLGRVQAVGNDATLNDLTLGAMLDVQGEVVRIQQGDTVLGQYRVLAIRETADGLQIQFLYLPLKQTQTLNAQLTN